MAKTISQRAGRIWLMCIVAICFIAAVLSLFVIARGGAISSDNRLDAAVKLISFYLPMLSLIGVFLFKDHRAHVGSETPIESFLFAIFITSIWVLTPLLLLWNMDFIEEVLAGIDKLRPLGDTITMGALGYYFSKGSS